MDTADPSDPVGGAPHAAQAGTSSARALALAALRAAQDEFDACVHELVSLRDAIARAELADSEVSALEARYRRAWDALRAARDRWRAYILACDAAGANRRIVVSSAPAEPPTAAARPEPQSEAAAEPLLPRALPRLRFARWLVETGRVTDWPSAA
jgi:hypothetical protein